MNKEERRELRAKIAATLAKTAVMEAEIAQMKLSNKQSGEAAADATTLERDSPAIPSQPEPRREEPAAKAAPVSQYPSIQPEHRRDYVARPAVKSAPAPAPAPVTERDRKRLEDAKAKVANVMAAMDVVQVDKLPPYMRVAAGQQMRAVQETIATYNAAPSVEAADRVTSAGSTLVQSYVDGLRVAVEQIAANANMYAPTSSWKRGWTELIQRVKMFLAVHVPTATASNAWQTPDIATTILNMNRTADNLTVAFKREKAEDDQRRQDAYKRGDGWGTNSSSRPDPSQSYQQPRPGPQYQQQRPGPKAQQRHRQNQRRQQQHPDAWQRSSRMLQQEATRANSLGLLQLANFYEYLDSANAIRTETSRAEVKGMYRKLAVKFHPDKTPPDGMSKADAETVFKRINELNAEYQDTSDPLQGGKKRKKTWRNKQRRRGNRRKATRRKRR
jgi:hypothetical protein